MFSTGRRRGRRRRRIAYSTLLSTDSFSPERDRTCLSDGQVDEVWRSEA